jgi:peroxiredoxin
MNARGLSGVVLQFLAVFLFLFFVSNQSFAQVVKFSPESPKWGDTVTFTYDSKSEGAKFTVSDDVYIVVAVRGENYTEKNLFGKMKRNGDAFVYEMMVGEPTAFIIASFITLDKFDNKNSAKFMVLNGAGKPARNARFNMIYSQNPMPMADRVRWLEEELKAYPDNFPVYQFKWMSGGTPKGNGVIVTTREDRERTVRNDLEKIKALGKGETIEFLHAQFFASFFLQDEKELKNTLFKIAEKYPQTELGGKCFEEYSKWELLRQLKTTTPEELAEVTELKKKIVAEHPASPFARSWLTRLSADLAAKDPSYELMAKIARQMIAEEDGNPFPHYYLGMALLEQKKDTTAALSSFNKAIERFLKGYHRLYQDLPGTMGMRVLSSAFRAKAQLLTNQGQLSEALAAVALAKEYQNEVTTKNAELEGDIWKRLERDDRSEMAYLEAVKLGSKSAESQLQALYSKRMGSTKGFDDYLAAKKKAAPETRESVAAQGFKVPGGTFVSGGAGGSGGKSVAPGSTAPVFSVTTLDGKNYDLAKLRGKVVVLNFWFVGCPGCDIEVESLNKLVQEFKDKEVVFLALALDDKARIEQYIKKNPFKFELIAKSQEISDLYGVTGYPTHVIIDKSGIAKYRLSGGSNTIHEKISPLINSLL